MAAKKKKRSAPRKRRRTTSLSSAPIRRRRRSSPRRKKRALSSGGGGGTKKITFAKALMGSGAGALGGVVYIVPKFVMKLPTWGKIAYGAGASVMASKFGATNVGAGIAGAMVMDMANTFMGVTLKDELEDVEYVNPDTLSDTGMVDEDGESVVMDDNGVVYALNDDGEYQSIGMAEDYDLEDNYDLSEYDLEDNYDLSANNIQSSAMMPLSDAYALSQASGWGGY